MTNFKGTVFTDGPFYVQKQSGSFADPNFYVFENVGEGVMVSAGKYPTLEAAQADISDWLAEAQRNSGL